MPGIIVGVDGSPDSQHALEWAMKEAAIRHAPLTVLTVHRASVGYWGSETRYPPDHAVAEHARQSAQDAVVKAAANLGEPGPESVTVHAVSGAPAEELITAGRDADMIVVGSRGAGVPATADRLGQQPRDSPCALPRGDRPLGGAPLTYRPGPRRSGCPAHLAPFRRAGPWCLLGLEHDAGWDPFSTSVPPLRWA